MLNRRRMLLGGTALATAAAIASVPFALRAQSGKAGEEVIAWLKANALPLATAEPGSGFHDLEPFRAMIGNARIVSMGEATHGTREFFQLKHRLIEYCVSKLGFTVIGFEANYGTTLAVNDYVLHGKGNAVDVVTGMGFWTWDTEEVLALVEWVRVWNMAHERKVKFYGFDIQDGAAAALHLFAYLERVAPHLAAVAERNLSPLTFDGRLCEFDRLPAGVQERAFAQIKTVLDTFRTQRMEWVSQTGELAWRLARQSAVVVEQHARKALIDTAGYSEASDIFRDRCMADNVRALLDAEGPGAKALLWAHNAHVQRAPYLGMRNMGSLLHDAYGAEYVVVGFSFNQGSFQAVGLNDNRLGNHVVGPAPESSLDGALAATGIPLLALDLTNVPADGPLAQWMASKPPQRRVGLTFAAESERRYFVAADPRDNYDVLVFVESTTAARANPTRSVRAPNTASGENEEPTNLELASSDGIPTGWRPINFSLYPYLVTVADNESPEDGRAVRIARAGSPLPWGDGALTQHFPAARWRGQRLVFSGAMRAEAPHTGTGARLVIMVWPKPKKEDPAPTRFRPIHVAQSDRPVRSRGWTHQSVAVDVPGNAEWVLVGLVVTGDSAGWFGDLALEAKGPAVGVTASALMPTAAMPNPAESRRIFPPLMMHHRETLTVL